MTDRGDGASRVPIGQTIWAARHDGWVRLAALCVVVSPVLLHFAPVGPRFSSVFLPVIFLLVPVTCLVGVRDLSHAAERRFWTAFASALLCRWLVMVGGALVSYLAPNPALLRLGNEFGLGAFYLLFLAAVARRPHAASWRPASLERLVTWPTALLFVTALLAYFVLLPRAFAPEAYRASAASELPFVVLDAFLAGQLFLYARETRGSRWRVTYLLLALTSTVWLIDDLRRTFENSRSEVSEPSISAMMIWLFAAVLAARLRHLPANSRHHDSTPASRSEIELSDDEMLLELEARAPQAASHTLAAAILLPILHIVFSRMGFFPESLRAHHDVLLFLALATLGALAWLQNSVLRRAVGTLHRARARSEEAVHRHLVDLQLQRERLRAESAVRSVEDRFASVFRACPSAMLITRLAEDQIVDLNESFEALTGYRRHECLGRTAEALGLWERSEERPAFVRDILAGRTKHNIRVSFRLRDGSRHPFFLDATRIELEDGPGLLALARPDPMLPRPTALEQSTTPMLGVDATLKVSMWSDGMSRLAGLPPISAIGQPLAEVLPQATKTVEPLVLAASELALETVRIEIETHAERIEPITAHVLTIPDGNGGFGAFLALDTQGKAP